MRYFKFKILEDSGMQYIWGEGPFVKEQLLNHAKSCFKSSELRGTEEKSFEAENSVL